MENDNTDNVVKQIHDILWDQKMDSYVKNIYCWMLGRSPYYTIRSKKEKVNSAKYSLKFLTRHLEHKKGSFRRVK